MTTVELTYSATDIVSFQDRAFMLGAEGQMLGGRIKTISRDIPSQTGILTFTFERPVETRAHDLARKLESHKEVISVVVVEMKQTKYKGSHV